MFGIVVGDRIATFRPLQPSSQQAAMYYATAGQQATQRGANGAGGIPVGGGFPPIGAIGRGGPPGFATRGAGEFNFEGGIYARFRAMRTVLLRLPARRL